MVKNATAQVPDTAHAATAALEWTSIHYTARVAAKSYLQTTYQQSPDFKTSQRDSPPCSAAHGILMCSTVKASLSVTTRSLLKVNYRQQKQHYEIHLYYACQQYNWFWRAIDKPNNQLRKASVTILSLSSLSVIDAAQRYNASVILSNLSQRQINPAFNSTELHIPVVNSPLSQPSMYRPLLAQATNSLTLRRTPTISNMQNCPHVMKSTREITHSVKYKDIQAPYSRTAIKRNASNFLYRLKQLKKKKKHYYLRFAINPCKTASTKSRHKFQLLRFFAHHRLSPGTEQT